MKSMNKFLLLFFLLLAPMVNAQEAEGEDKADSLPLMYYEIDPKILTFYQTTGKKLGYVVVEVSVVVRGQENYDHVELNKPLIQDALIDYFNRLDQAAVSDLQKRESIRQKAAERVSGVIEAEVGKKIVEDLLFTEYIFQ
ncbi:MAG: flagellar basal body-associated FliL family protein [Gammaproteobacteria bacterium]|nr:flagellar basal body-associated FliL family protein [Gammaproteobacteria bacterium]